MGDTVADHNEERLVLRCARARQRYWVTQRDAARIANDRCREREAQRFIDEYSDFIAFLLNQAEADVAVKA